MYPGIPIKHHDNYPMLAGLTKARAQGALNLLAGRGSPMRSLTKVPIDPKPDGL